ncbi:hypothetical protein [Aureispira anguillae]|uniref:Antitoxin component YwqK of the YwqJK toxin-antitoxin module n=1 Tax=Aureispira anguillae TaxID=2864201 RepID=A0A915YIR9_9BACT|nr:hypothetical protein [Aureispira anguillae]BDS13963.1 hypothetical protein AsAng_0047260 [Aureispira anguillae]
MKSIYSTKSNLYLCLIQLFIVLPIQAQTHSAVNATTILGIPTIYLFFILGVFHLPFVLISFFYAVNSSSYSEEQQREYKIGLGVLLIINSFIFSYPLYQNCYIYPSLILFAIPLFYFLIGFFQWKRPFINWILSILYVFTLILFALGGNKNSQGYGPKDGLYTTYYNTPQKQIQSSQYYSFGFLHGSSKQFYENGQLKSSCSYNMDTLEGIAQEYYPNGQLKNNGTYHHNKVSGLYQSYHSNGQLASEQNFIAGVLNDTQKTFYKNSQLKSLHYYEKGKKIGSCKTYHPNGQLKSSCTFNKDEQGLYQSYHPNGQLKETGQLNKERKDGLWNTYYPNGNLSSSGYYLVSDYNKAIKQGLWKTYYPNGQLKTSGEYQKGIRKGKWVKFFDTGEQSDQYDYGI